MTSVRELANKNNISWVHEKTVVISLTANYNTNERSEYDVTFDELRISHVGDVFSPEIKFTAGTYETATVVFIDDDSALLLIRKYRMYHMKSNPNNTRRKIIYESLICASFDGYGETRKPDESYQLAIHGFLGVSPDYGPTYTGHRVFIPGKIDYEDDIPEGVTCVHLIAAKDASPLDIACIVRACYNKKINLSIETIRTDGKNEGLIWVFKNFTGPSDHRYEDTTTIPGHSDLYSVNGEYCKFEE